MKILVNKDLLIKIGLGMVITIVTLLGFLTYNLYKESREHDRLPVILSNSIRMGIVDNNLYASSEYKDGDNCSQIEQKTVLQAIHEPDDNQFHTCKRFAIEKGVFHWIEKTSYTVVVLEKTSGIFELVIKDTGEYGNFKNYPGISSFRMRGNSKDVVFAYEGWNNPRKIIKLSVN